MTFNISVNDYIPSSPVVAVRVKTSPDVLIIRVIGKRLIEALRYAAKERDTELDRLHVIFMQNLGVGAGILRDIASVAPEEIIEITLMPNGEDRSQRITNKKPIIQLEEVALKSRQKIYLHEVIGETAKKLSFRLDCIRDELPEQTFDPWIKKAVAKDTKKRTHPEWAKLHWGDFATNERVIHFDKSRVHFSHVGVEIPEYVSKAMKKFRQSKWGVIVDSKAIKQAATGAKATSEGWVRLEIKSRMIEVTAVQNGTGKATRKVKAKELTAKRPAGDIKVAVDVKYLIDALSGMKGDVTIRTNGRDVFWMQCGDREAFIQPMNV